VNLLNSASENVRLDHTRSLADKEAIFTKSMLHDHLPSGYERATQLLYDGIDENNVAIA
jgi:hypothetical protein